jgi:hypothetical protein
MEIINRMFGSTRQTVTIALMLHIFLMPIRTIEDPDLWWHLKTGQYIIETKTIPHTDIYSHTSVGKEWVAHEWLSEVMMYAIYRSMGWAGLFFIFSLLVVLSFWIAYTRCRKDAPPLVVAAIIVVAQMAAMPTIAPRPRIFTLLFTSIFLAILDQALRGNKRNVWWLVPCMVLWVNLHGGFLLGPALIVLAIAGTLLNGWQSNLPKFQILARIRTLSLVLIACFLAGAINPNTMRIYSYPFETVFSPVQQSVIQDWFSPDFHDSSFIPLAILILATMAAYALSTERERPSDLLFILASCFATLKSARHVSIFALAVIPSLVEHWHNWVITTNYGKRATAPETTAKGLPLVLNFILVLTVGLAHVPRIYRTLVHYPTYANFVQPVEAVEYIRMHNLPTQIFNKLEWGGYMIWTIPSYRVYIDGRPDMYGDAFVTEYLKVYNATTNWREYFDRYGVRTVLIDPTAPLSYHLHQQNDWVKTFEDQKSIIFTKK